MGVFIVDIISNPYYDLVVVISLCVGIGFVIFLSGFLSGFGHLYKIEENEEHLNHYRARALWGTMLVLFFFILWEIVRFVAGLF